MDILLLCVVLLSLTCKSLDIQMVQFDSNEGLMLHTDSHAAKGLVALQPWLGSITVSAYYFKLGDFLGSKWPSFVAFARLHHHLALGDDSKGTALFSVDLK